MLKYIISITLLFSQLVMGQDLVSDNYYIKSFQFEGVKQSVFPIFKLKQRIKFSFDDLMGNESSFSYKIIHCDRKWNPSNLLENEYLSGPSQMNIQQINNSFTTLQNYSHYTVEIPNGYQYIKISGNYLLQIFDTNEDLVLIRKFIIYEDLIAVQLEAKRTRDLNTINSKQRIKTTLDCSGFSVIQPKKNISLVLLQNGRFDTAISDLQPEYILGNKIIYNDDTKSSFFSGNEFLFVDNGDIRSSNNSVAKVTTNDLFESTLYTDQPNVTQTYSFTEDVNGAFYPYVKYKEKEVFSTESDYAWVYFSLDYEKQAKPIYILGMFNNYTKSEDYEMVYNNETKHYELALLLKQGFTNYTYCLGKQTNEHNNIFGNYAETENQYHAIVYYKNAIDRHDRVIGLGFVKSLNLSN